MFIKHYLGLRWKRNPHHILAKGKYINHIILFNYILQVNPTVTTICVKPSYCIMPLHRPANLVFTTFLNSLIYATYILCDSHNTRYSSRNLGSGLGTYELLTQQNVKLGVRVISPVYAIVPETLDYQKNVTVVLSIWLKRVGQRAGPYDLPHQAQVWQWILGRHYL